MASEGDMVKKEEGDSRDLEVESTHRSSIEVDPPGQKADYDDNAEAEEDDDEEEDQEDKNDEIKKDQADAVTENSEFDNEDADEDGAGKSPVKEELLKVNASEKEKEVDNNYIEEKEEEEEEKEEELPMVGGKIKKKSFCLLDGMFEVSH